MENKLILHLIIASLFYSTQVSGQTSALKDSMVKYITIGDLEKAIPFAEKRAAYQKTDKGEESAEYAGSLITWGDLLQRVGRLTKAGPVLKYGLNIWLKLNKTGNQNLGTPYMVMGYYYLGLGDGKNAEDCFKSALLWRQKVVPIDFLGIANVFENLGNAYIIQGDFFQAQEFLTKSLFIKKRIVGDFHPAVASSTNNLANFYKTIGNFELASELYQSAMNAYKAKFSDNDPTYALYANNLGSARRMEKNFTAALEWDKKALEIRKSKLGPDHPELAVAYNSLGSVYFDISGYFLANQYFNRAISICKAQSFNENPDLVDYEYNLGFLFLKMANYPVADSLFQKVERIRKTKNGEDHPQLNSVYLRRGILFYENGEYAKAEAKLLALNKNLLIQSHRYFPFLTSKEKEKYAESLNEGKEQFQSISVARIQHNPSIGGPLYDNQLATKAILLSSNKAFINRIRRLNDSSLNKKFTEWEVIKSTISKAKTGSLNIEEKEVSSLELEAEILEKSLATATMEKAEEKTWKNLKWQDVQKRLKKGQAAIEMVRIKKWGTTGTITDTTDPDRRKYTAKGLTDTILYAALIVKPGFKYPKIVILENGNDLEGKWIEAYKSKTKLRLKDNSSYFQYWKKISNALGGKTREIYFSPDGIYNSINLNSLRNPSNGKYIIDELDIRLITNTKDLISAEFKSENKEDAFLVGYPNYNTPFEKRLREIESGRTRKAQLHSLNKTRGELFSDLPGTKEEVENIASMLQQGGWNVNTLMGDSASEENIKEVQQPGILHIATHGFFNSNAMEIKNPLLYSGLLLSSANRTIAGEKPNPLQEDGVLSAYEAMNLNLDNTDLVVLSACETGLGEIKNGEGVYGLQRAFKVAGAKSIIMSLWKVDDDATQELMVSFYKYWIKNAVGAAGQTANVAQTRLSAGGGTDGKRAAFRKAQKELKAKYPEPYYWGAFVMVGE